MGNSPNFAEPSGPRLSWNEQQETANAIEQFSVGLWRIFIGSLLVTVALVGIYLPLIAAFFDAAMLQLLRDPRLSLPVLLCSIAGAWIYFSGKQHCLAFTLAVQKRYLLTASLGCDIGAFLFRFVRDVPVIGPPSRIAASMLVLVGFLMLLGFFAYLAKLIGARVSYFMGIATGAMAVGAMVLALFSNDLAGLMPPAWGWLPLAIVTLLLLTTTSTYLILTATLSYQLKHFSRFLRQSLEEEIAEAYAHVD